MLQHPLIAFALIQLKHLNFRKVFNNCAVPFNGRDFNDFLILIHNSKVRLFIGTLEKGFPKDMKRNHKKAFNALIRASSEPLEIDLRVL
jgi:hypothetical protein